MPMSTVNKDEIIEYIRTNIGEFHSKRLASFETLKFDKILKRKNPYLFRAKGIDTAEELVATIMDAHLSSQEETIFGDFLEGLAIFINEKVYRGKKSSANGIDLEFEKEGVKYIVSIKSGPNWGNSSQISKMKADFSTAKRVLNTNTSKTNVVAVNGCCYGRDSKPDKGEYLKLCGQRFWEFISGDENLYKEIIEPLAYEVEKNNTEFTKAKEELIKRFTEDFAKEYCVDGIVDWNKILEVNSGQ
jgi:hypothetical protein